MVVTVGGTTKVNRSPRPCVLAPPRVATVVCTVPAACAGVTALIRVEESTRKLRAGAPPKVTAVAPLKLRPVMVTVLPPPVGPLTGLMAVTVGVLAAATTWPCGSRLGRMVRTSATPTRALRRGLNR